MAASAASIDGRLRVARLLLRAQRPLGAAVLLAELARKGNREPEVWTALGAALLGARHALMVKPFEQWAAWVLREAEPITFGTPFAQPRLELARDLAPPATEDPFDAYALDQLVAFLLTRKDVLITAVDGLAPAERVLAVALLAETSVHAVPVVAAAIGGRWDAAAARAALSRCQRFLDRPEIRAAIAAATRSPARALLEPFLGRAFDRMNQP